MLSGLGPAARQSTTPWLQKPCHVGAIRANRASNARQLVAFGPCLSRKSVDSGRS
jgi:hypothetical protein